MSEQEELIERLKHFEKAQRDASDSYGAEVLFHARREIVNLTMERDGANTKLDAALKENERLREERGKIAGRIYQLPEINLNNYDEGDLGELNDAAIKLWELLPEDVQTTARAALAAEGEGEDGP